MRRLVNPLWIVQIRKVAHSVSFWEEKALAFRGKTSVKRKIQKHDETAKVNNFWQICQEITFWWNFKTKLYQSSLIIRKDFRDSKTLILKRGGEDWNKAKEVKDKVE